jgi:hypothetical protein
LGEKVTTWGINWKKTTGKATQQQQGKAKPQKKLLN